MDADADLSETRSVPLAAAASPSEELVVAYDRADESIRFRGIEVPSDSVQCVGGVSRVEGLDRAPLLLTTTLRAGWRTDALYQRLR